MGNTVSMSALNEQTAFTPLPCLREQHRHACGVFCSLLCLKCWPNLLEGEERAQYTNSRHLCMERLEPSDCFPFLGASGSPSCRLC